MVGKNTDLSINTLTILPYMMVFALYLENGFPRTQPEVTTKCRCDRLQGH